MKFIKVFSNWFDHMAGMSFIDLYLEADDLDLQNGDFDLN